MEENGNATGPPLVNRSGTVQEISDQFKDIHLNGNDDGDDDSFSAPFEILAEFLSAVMTRDYKTALHYCKLILQYEPENITVQEFYPLIEQKIKIEAESSVESNEYSESSDDGYGKQDTEGSTEYYSSASNKGSATSSSSCLSSESDIEEEDAGDGK